MEKYLSLCVELRRGKLAKEGLHQYRLTCQQYNIQSLEVVVKHFLEQAEERTKEAQSAAAQVLLDIEDLEDSEETQETILISTVTGEDTKERTDRQYVTPWLKFLWETYRTVLEILRNNNKLEQLYAETSKRAFSFCIKYKRHTEFRRLTEMLRTHLANISKYANQTQAVNLNSPESLQLHLDTRFDQLHAASELELWQECYKSIEDIHGLLTLAVSKKPGPKTQLIATYYQKLAQIFLVSENYVFHAYTLNKFYTLSKNYNKNLTEEESRVLSSSVLLSTLCIPLSDKKDPFDDFDAQSGRKARLSLLLTFNNVPVNPTRDSLIDDLSIRNFSNYVYPQLKDFLYLMENKFQPLQLTNSLKPKLDFIREHPVLKQYIKPLEKLMFIRLLQQLSRVYDTLKIKELSKLVYFANFFEVEKLVVESVKKGYVDLRIDHQNSAIIFKCQSLESQQLRPQLTTLSNQLQSAMRLINPEKHSESTYVNKKKDMYSKIIQNLQVEHERVIQRKIEIEKKKERIEQELRAKQQEEEEEAKRKEEEIARIAREKQQQYEAEMEDRLKANKLNEQPVEESSEELVRKKIEQHEKEQNELIKKLDKLSKRIDWVERAKLREERPLVKEWYKQQLIEEEELYKQQTIKFVTDHKANWVKEVEEKKRLSRMINDKTSFENEIMNRRKAAFEIIKKERDERIAVKRAKREEEQKKREEDEERRRIEIERNRIERDQLAERKRIEEEEKRRQDEEHKRKLLEIEEKKRKREEEVLAKQQETRRNQEDKPISSTTSTAGKYVPPTQRDRESTTTTTSTSGRYVPPTQRYV